MTPLHHLVEPAGLLLTWQPQDEHAPNRTRRVVGEVQVKNGTPTFTYLKDSEDFEKAKACGFKGYPAFEFSRSEFPAGVLESFMRRLPPRKREDFADFLALHRLPHPFPLSDIALLAYTGARLPSDGFALVPIFDVSQTPCEFLLEVAGFRHAADTEIENVREDDAVSFEHEDNPIDRDALAIMHNGFRIGYVNRALRCTLQHWLKNNVVTAKIERKNGKPTRPLVYLRVLVR